MGSRKLKVKKKVKVKRLKKFQRLKKINRTKYPASELCLEPNFVETLSGVQDIFNNRLCDQQIYSRFYIDDDIPKIKKFIQVRERYFGYLQTVIKNNCAYNGSPVPEDTVDSLSLKLEQHALLSSLEIDIYENFLTKIISGIEKCTKERQIHKGVKILLPDSEDQEAEYEKCSETTAISNSTDSNLNENEITDQSVFDSETLNQCPSDSQQYSEPYTLPQDSDQMSFFSDIRTDDDFETASKDNLNFIRKEPESLQPSKADISQASPSIREVSSPLQNDCDSSNKNEDLNSIPLSSKDFIDNETCNTVSESSKLIEESMEGILSQNENGDESLEENDERDYINQILEEQNTSGDRIDNFENEAESAENEDGKENGEQVESKTERNLAKRLEKMRSLFNIDERKPKRKVSVKVIKPKKSEPNENYEDEQHLRLLTAWRNEKIIQLYKVSVLTSRLSYEKREEMQKLFIELFGEDSDEEHEFEYGSTDQFKMSCIERISSWVVKHLMPFYYKRRIIGRKMFKSLGRRISEAIIDKIQYPDERTVKYFVYKFFPPNKRYVFKSKCRRRLR